MNHKIDRDTYIIPPNFIESGTFFGGMFKARNVIEAGILAFAIGVPVFSLILPLQLAASMGRAASPIAGVIVAIAGVAGVSSVELARRNTFPLIGGIVFLILYHLITF